MDSKWSRVFSLSYINDPIYIELERRGYTVQERRVTLSKDLTIYFASEGRDRQILFFMHGIDGSLYYLNKFVSEEVLAEPVYDPADFFLRHIDYALEIAVDQTKRLHLANWLSRQV